MAPRSEQLKPSQEIPISRAIPEYASLPLSQEVIASILLSGRIGPNIQLAECYGLRLKHMKSDETHWLHPLMTVGEVQDKYECLHVEAEWRYWSLKPFWKSPEVLG